MGHRANFVLIRNGQARAYYDQWAAMGCVHQFAAGPGAAARAVEVLSDTTELLEWAFAEGGYLIDFDRKEALVFGPSPVEFGLDDLGEFEDLVSPEELAEAAYLDQALASSPDSFLQLVQPQWHGWLLTGTTAASMPSRCTCVTAKFTPSARSRHGSRQAPASTRCGPRRTAGDSPPNPSLQRTPRSPPFSRLAATSCGSAQKAGRVAPLNSYSVGPAH